MTNRWLRIVIATIWALLVVATSAPVAEAAMTISQAVMLWQRLLGRPASESGTLCHGDGAHGRGDRRRRVLMWATLFVVPKIIAQPLGDPACSLACSAASFAMAASSALVMACSVWRAAARPNPAAHRTGPRVAGFGR